MTSNYCPYSQKSLWKGPSQYPYVLPGASNQPYTPYVPWNRGMHKITSLRVESPLPKQKHPCTCRDMNNRIPVHFTGKIPISPDEPAGPCTKGRKIDYMKDIFG